MGNVTPISTLPALRGKGVLYAGINEQLLADQAPTTVTIQHDIVKTTIDEPYDAVTNGALDLNQKDIYQAVGFKVENSLSTLAGHDQLVAAGIADNAFGFYVANGKTLDMGAGNDKLTANMTGFGSKGILNDGVIDTGIGLDNISLISDSDALEIAKNASFKTGANADKLVASSINGSGIVNHGQMILGGDLEVDKDLIVADSDGGAAVPAYTPGQPAILNTGTIKFGGGKDVLDAIAGGFAGGGTFDMGADNDSVDGFGDAVIFGGAGRNGLTLPDGTYTVHYVSDRGVTGHKPVSLLDTASGYVTREGSSTGGFPTKLTFDKFDGIGGGGTTINGSAAGGAGLHFVLDNALTGTVELLRTFSVNALGNVTVGAGGYLSPGNAAFLA